MRYLNIFFNVLILFLLLLFVFSLSGLLLKAENLFFLRSLVSIKSIFNFIWLNLIIEHSNFVIISFALSVVSYFLFFNLSFFKSKTFFLIFLIPTITIAAGLFYFEFFIFKSIKKDIANTLDKIKNNTVDSINYEKFFKSDNVFMNYFTTKFYMYIKSRKFQSASGYYADSSNIVFLKNFRFYLKDNKIIIRPQFVRYILSKKNISSLKLSFKNNNIMKSFMFSPVDFSKYFFILFIILPIAILFNNKNWSLKSIIFFSIALPILIILVTYYNKFCINICSNINIKAIDTDIYIKLFKNEILLSLSYIVVGIFLFRFVGNIKDLIPRIEIEKIKRISV